MEETDIDEPPPAGGNPRESAGGFIVVPLALIAWEPANKSELLSVRVPHKIAFATHGECTSPLADGMCRLTRTLVVCLHDCRARYIGDYDESPQTDQLSMDL